MLGAGVSPLSWELSIDLWRLKDNLRKISRMRREHMLTEQMKDAMKRANCGQIDVEGEINRRKGEERMFVCD